MTITIELRIVAAYFESGTATSHVQQVAATHVTGPVMIQRMRLAAVASLLVGACSFQARPGTGAREDGGTIDDADAIDVRPVGRCGTPGAITEGFASGLARWQTGAAMVSQAGGELVVANGTITSKSHVDLIGSSAELEVASIGDTDAVFRLAFDQNRYLGIEARGAELFAVDSGSPLPAVAFGPGDRFWRISERAGTVTFEASPDRATWRLLGSRPTPVYAKAVRLVVGVVATTGPVPAHFAGVDRGGEAATWCKAKVLVDTFASIDVNPFGTRWNNSARGGPSCTLAISGGTARSNQDGSGPADCWFGSSAAYDLRGGAVSTYIITISSFAPGWQTYLAIRDDSDRSATIAFDNNEMCASGTGITRTCVAYASNDEYWRIREDAGMLHFEISTNNTAWLPVRSIAAPFAVDAVRIRVGTVADRPLGGGIGLSISDINP